MGFLGWRWGFLGVFFGFVVDLFEEGVPSQQRTLTGRQLMTNFELRMTRRGTSLLVRYKPQP